MRKISMISAIVCLVWAAAAQELQHEVTTLNIEVPVRVFAEGRFVDDLTIRDFEVYEDGKPQKIEAVYLVRARLACPRGSEDPVNRWV